MTSLNDLLSQDTREPVARNSRPTTQGLEVYLPNDNDEMFVTFATPMTASKIGEDPYVATHKMARWRTRSENGGYRWNHVVTEINREKAQGSNFDVIPQSKNDENLLSDKLAFSLWVYVHEMVRDVEVEGSVEKQTSAGVRYEEPVNDYKILSLGYQLGQFTIEQLDAIKDDWNGDLTKGVIRVRRKGGKGDMNTKYFLTATSRRDAVGDLSEPLPNISDYIQTRYGDIYRPMNGATSDTNPVQLEVKQEISEEIDSLF